MNVVVVESPAKAKSINHYLGDGYTVLASYGHVRDLPPKDGSVRPDADFAMDWEVDPKARKRINEIVRALKGARCLYLATDPDREGEAISWHVREVLDQRRALDGIDVKRVVFNEVTRGAVLYAFDHPRELDTGLIEAYLARRALDYLVGFTLSPVLWRKLPGSRSAGRVQSVALRLICDREAEIEAFAPREYWTVDAALTTRAEASFSARLTHLDGHKLVKMGLGDNDAAQRAVGAVEDASFTVAKVERKKTRRNPAPPFTTSTLQQEASRKLHFGAKRTMMIAQRLYEGVRIGGETVGLITYMRTDGVQISGEAIDACRRLIGATYGDVYIPDKPRRYRSKAKNAQEAHEAIRPTDVARHPRNIASRLDDDQRRLYELIWKRTVASQMEAAVLDQVAADIASAESAVMLRATGSVVAFDGFFRLYREGRDDAEGDNGERILPDLKEGEALTLGKVTPEQHFTQPPPRYGEASLVKTLEELGIGRPSTYTSIISVLQDRDYVRLEKRRFVPEERGRLVTAFLSSFFARYVEYSFTAELEDKLDDISGGRIDWKTVLREFWTAFNEAVAKTNELGRREVLEALDELLAPYLFREGAGEGEGDPRLCKSCGDGRLNLKLGRYGAFIGCTNYPQCRYTRPLVGTGDESAPATDNGPRVLGRDPLSGLEVTLRRGPYGVYAQLGEAAAAKAGSKAKAKAKDKDKPKRVSLVRGMDAERVDLEQALALLALPREVGVHPESGETITAGIGRYGPYIRHTGVYLSLKGDDDVLTIGLNRAVALIADAPARKPVKTLGDHPKDAKPVTLRSGRWGPYVQHGALRANLAKGTSEDTVTLETALALLKARAANKPAKRKPAARKKKK